MRFKPYGSFDLLAAGLLPPGWDDEVRRCLHASGVDTVLKGDSATSREQKPNIELRVRVADGFAVQKSLPWLRALYCGPLLDFAQAWFGQQLHPAMRIHTAVNINQLSGRGARYEWHVDSNPVTGLLFVTTAARGGGGSLVFRNAEGRRSIVRPRAGQFICFDAREIPHRVAPLKFGDRVSVPMNYYISATVQPRPDDLDSRIYTAAV